ncbi:LamB/YcsF family protein [Mycobacterium sp. NPDC003449]
MAPRVALTTDIGEGLGRWSLGDDDALLDIVTSANIACGFHGGDPSTMRRTCAISVKNNVAIGAQVSYRDLHGFGRRYIAVPGPELRDDFLYQMGALEVFARLAGGQVDFVRAHGALWTVVIDNTEHAKALVDATLEFNPKIPLLASPGSEVWRIGEEAGLRMMAEAFVDRAYTPRGFLQSRLEPNALLTDADAAAARAVQMVTEGQVTANDGSRVAVNAETLLVHCDTPGAVDIARKTRAALEAAGIELYPIR